VSGDLERRTWRGRLALPLRLIGAVVAVGLIGFRFGLVAAAAAAVCGGLLVVAARRRRASSEPGPIWTASADLMRGGGRWPGQLSVLPNEIVWAPSKSSIRRGLEGVRADKTHIVQLQDGIALTDVYLTLTSPGREPLTLLTHRSRRLAAALHAFNTAPH
jgi:hypothetical protein